MVQSTGWPDGGVRIQNLHMTRETRMPAILCECGFISNPAQELLLKTSEVQTRIARAIVDGICEFLDSEAGQPKTEQWKLDIMEKAFQQGLIKNRHNAEMLLPSGCAAGGAKPA